MRLYFFAFRESSAGAVRHKHRSDRDQIYYPGLTVVGQPGGELGISEALEAKEAVARLQKADQCN